MAKDGFGRAKVVAMERNLGYVRANNHAIRESTGRFILLLNPDTRLMPGSLDAMIDFMVEHADAGALGCKQLDDRMDLQLTWGRFPNFRTELVRKTIHSRFAINGATVREVLESGLHVPSDVDWVSGSCLMVRREVIARVGLMDENIFMYFEDIDWCYRIKKADWRIYYTPKTHIIHHGGASANKHKIDALVHYRRSQFYFTRKWYGRVRLAGLKALMTAKALVGMVRWGIPYLRAPEGADARHEALCMLLIHKRTLGLVFEKVPAAGHRADDR